MNKYSIARLRKIGSDRIFNFILNKMGFSAKYRWKIIKRAKITAHPYAYITRKRKIKDLVRQYPPRLSLPETSQFLFLQPEDIPGISDIVAHCQKVFEQRKDDVEAYYQKSQDFKSKVFLIGKHGEKKRYCDFQEIKPLIEFATRPDIVSMVANYLGEMPLLGNIFLMHTDVNDKTIDSQKFHFDKRDHNRFQFFIAVHDVDHDAGPFTLIPADKSTEIARKMNYYDGRVPDEKMYQYISPKETIPFTGKAGSTLMINASRCFHYGSRSRKKPRLIIEIMYASRFNAIGVGDLQLRKVIRKEDRAKLSDPLKII